MGKKREPSSSSSDSDSSPDAQIKTLPVARDTSPEPSNSPDSKKRKRSIKATDNDAEELEIDVNAPEPPSKAAARKAKKAKLKPTKDGETASTEVDASNKAENGGRSLHGIWIGNLPFSTDKTLLRVFFTRQGGIPDEQITRVHMPAPRESGPPLPGRTKPTNKGFAYVDFSTKETCEKAIAMSETLMSGRKVLIKDARSYEGRPEKATATTDALEVAASGDSRDTKAPGAKGPSSNKEPSKRVFVGNLGFDVSKDDLETHFAQAGEIEDVHMATFEDSGKCKGFAWVRFVELSSAEAAVKGFVFKEEPDSDAESAAESSASSDDNDSDSGAEEKKPKKAKKVKKQKKRKWFINRLLGRPLRCEFAEDAASRYKKRFGKTPTERTTAGGDGAITEVADGAAGKPEFKKRDRSGDAAARQEMRRKKHVDARTIRPGAALANAPRASGAIVEGKGKKISFD